MKKGVFPIFLAVCLSGTLLAGCGAKAPDANTNGGSSASVPPNISSAGSEATPQEISDSHTPVTSSSFEINGVHFQHRDGIEMECLVIDDRYSEITLDGVMLHVDVRNKEDESDWYDSVVSRGNQGTSSGGDSCYQSVNDVLWEFATDSGKLIVMYGDQDSTDDWQSIAEKLDWSVTGSPSSGASMNHASQSKEEDPENKFTIQNGLFKLTGDGVFTSSGQPLVLSNLTLSEVLLTDMFESMYGDFESEEEMEKLENTANYYLGYISHQFSEDEWGGVPFSSYFAPSDATITFYPSEENMSFHFEGYNISANERDSGFLWQRSCVGSFGLNAEDMEPIVLKMDDFKKYMPDFNYLVCYSDQSNWFEVMFVG